MIERHIERRGDGAFDYRLHGGEGGVQIQWYFFDRSELPVAVHRWELPPGASEGSHEHPSEHPLEEMYVVMAGSAAMRVDDETYQLRPGDAVLAPVGSRHDVRNIGDDTLQLMVVWGPPGRVDWSSFGTAKAARARRQHD